MKYPALLLAALLPGALAGTNDWPVYRHDVALTGVSPGKGRINKPEIKWEYYLGAPPVTIAADRKAPDPNVADLDGDGTAERFALNGKTIQVSDLAGKLLWRHDVNGFPLGGNVRVVKLLQDRKGLQIISFSHRMDTGEGQGYCFAFDKGATTGELAWTTGPLASQYAPTLIVDDVDGDGLPDIVTAPHYSVQIFNGQTGALKADVKEAKGRNYGVLLSRPRPDSKAKDIFVISDFVLHAECVRFENGKWFHAWGKKYLEDENSARPQGREMYIRVGPNPVGDLDGDGRDELAYMLVDAAKDDQWHLIVHDCANGAIKADVPGVWVWSMADLNGDGRMEILYTATREKRPATYCELRVGQLRGGKLTDLAVLPGVRPVTMNATLPPTVGSIADEGQLDVLRADLTLDGRPELFVAERSRRGQFDDAFAAYSFGRGTSTTTKSSVKSSAGGNSATLPHPNPLPLGEGESPSGLGNDMSRRSKSARPKIPEERTRSPLPAGEGWGEGESAADPTTREAPPHVRLNRVWNFSQRGHRLILVSAANGEVRLNDLSAGKVLSVDAAGKLTRQIELGKPGGFSTLPIVADLNGDGRNEIIVQNAVGEILALEPPRARKKSPRILWSQLGMAMNISPGYSMAGGLCPQAADLDGDGKLEVLFAAEDERGLSSLVCVDGRGRLKWRTSIPGCPWGGLQAGVDHWTFGRFTGRPRGLDVYVDLHRRSKGSGEGWLLRGDTGAVAWQRKGIVAKETAMPFGGGIPSVADVNGDGVDDLAQMFFTVYGVTDGRTGEPLFPPAFLTGAGYFGKWLAYCEPTVADLNGDGRLDVYLNSRSYARGGYAAVQMDGKPLWAEFHNNDEGSDGLGPVGDFDGDGKLEIAVPVLNGSLLCLNAADGAHKWSIKTPVTGDVIAVDINSDGLKELLFAGRDGQLRAVSGTDGHEVWAIKDSGKPIVADLDGDGLVEVLAVGDDGVLRVIGNGSVR